MTSTLHYLIVGGIFWAVICRARHMDVDTPLALKVKYQALLAGAVLSLPIYTSPEWGQILLGASVLLYLLIDARRWRHGVPRWN